MILRRPTTEVFKNVVSVIERLEASLVILGNKLDRLAKEDKKVDDYWKTISCDGCKCMLYRGFAIKGKSEVKTRSKFVDFNFYPLNPGRWVDEEYISNSFYCHKCAPKEEEPKNDTSPPDS